MNKAARKYYRQIKTILGHNGHYERDLLQHYQQQIEELCQTQPDLTYDFLLERFGTPTDLLNQYCQAAGFKSISQRIQISDWLKTGGILLLILALACAIMLGIYAYYVSNLGITIIPEKNIIRYESVQ